MAEASPPQITRMEDIPLDNQSVELPVRELIVFRSIVYGNTPARTSRGCAALICSKMASLCPTSLKSAAPFTTLSTEGRGSLVSCFRAVDRLG